MNGNQAAQARRNEPVMVALVASGLILIMSALVVLPALFLGHGPAFRQQRMETLALARTGLDGTWKKLEADPPFVSAWHNGKTGVFFFSVPLGTDSMPLCLAIGPKDKKIFNLEAPSPTNLPLLASTMTRMQTQLDAPEAMPPESNPDLKVRDRVFADLVARAQKILAGKGR